MRGWAATLDHDVLALLAATFEPRQEGPFALQLGSSHPLAPVGRLPHEGAGLQRTVYRSEWSHGAGTAAARSRLIRSDVIASGYRRSDIPLPDTGFSLYALMAAL